MNGDKQQSGKQTARENRSERLAKALRENLRKRKARAADKQSPKADEPATDGGS